MTKNSHTMANISVTTPPTMTMILAAAIPAMTTAI